jgi:hypothetical protein
MYGTTIEYWELLLAPLYLLLPIAFIFFFPKRSERKWFALGVSAKIAGAIFYTLIYLFYYRGGDTVAYYATAVPFVRMFIQDPITGLELLFSSYSVENFARFNADTGYPLGYIYSEPDTFMVSRVITPFLLLGFNSYLLGSILIATFSFFGPWKLYQLFRTLSPNAERIALISALFFPSVIFWGSGISKDTITYASLCYLVYGFYHTVIRRNLSIWRIVFSLMTVYFIVTIKPYVFLAMLPGALIWYFFRSIQTIQNRIIRIAFVPFILFLSLGLFALTYSYIGDFLGDYSSTEKIIEKAIVSQEDLKRDYYGGNTFDIGTIEPTIFGIISKFPLATFYGFYGPTLIQVNNIVMFFSAIENSFLLLITLAIFVFRNPFKTLQKISQSPFLIFCLSFSVFLAFAIGLTTPNFGALVRFKIPLIPFFCFLLLSLYYRSNVKS